MEDMPEGQTRNFLNTHDLVLVIVRASTRKAA
jgi:hypothetical protein